MVAILQNKFRQKIEHFACLVRVYGIMKFTANKVIEFLMKFHRLPRSASGSGIVVEISLAFISVAATCLHGALLGSNSQHIIPGDGSRLGVVKVVKVNWLPWLVLPNAEFACGFTFPFF